MPNPNHPSSSLASKIEGLLPRDNADRLLGCGLGSLFFFFCWRMARVTHLWGDEAYSLQCASMPWRDLWLLADIHTPTYYAFLKLLTPLTGGLSHEVALRLCHAPFFLVGFYFGFQCLREAFNDRRIAWSAVGLSMGLPLFPYYATNLRMYGLVFAAGMWFARETLRSLREQEPNGVRLGVLLSGTLLLFSDYVGFLFYGLGAAFIAARWARRGAWRSVGWLLVPPLVLAAALAPRFLHNLALVAGWSSGSVQAIQGLTWMGGLYNRFRPLIDLVDVSRDPLYLRVAQWAAWVFLIALGAREVFTSRVKTGVASTVWVLSCAFLFVLTAFGAETSPSRAYLCSQFFLMGLAAVGFWAWRAPGALKGILGVALVVLSLQASWEPLPRLHGWIPTRDVARHVARQSAERKIPEVVLSGGSLENLPIKLYLQSAAIQTSSLHLNESTLSGDGVPQGEFLYLLNRLDEAEDSGVKLLRQAGRRVTEVERYVNLMDSPYNAYWKNHFVRQAGGETLFELYDVR